MDGDSAEAGAIEFAQQRQQEASLSDGPLSLTSNTISNKNRDYCRDDR